MIHQTYLAAVLATAAPFAAPANAATRVVDLTGLDHTGYLSMSCLKNWATEPPILLPSGLPDYPYQFKPAALGGQGVWTSIVAEPLSASSIYPEETVAPVVNKAITDPDFSTRTSGRVIFDDAALTGVGTEVVPATQVTIEVENDSFSPLNSVHNTGSGLGNAGWSYEITTTPLSGPGITLTDGVVTSIDIVADVSVTVFFFTIPLPVPYEGTMTLTGTSFFFDVDVTQDNITPLDPVVDTRLVFNRTGSILGLPVAPCATDVNQDGSVDVEDLYELAASPQDLNGDTLVNAADTGCLRAAVRINEVADVEGVR